MWLLDQQTFLTLQRAEREAGPTAEQRAQFIAQNHVAEGRTPKNMQIAGSAAEIRIEGILTKRADLLAYLFGGGNTTYASIREGLAIARTDPTIKSVTFLVDSPGGSVDGLFETLDTIKAFPKSIRVRAANALSAAYAIAAVAGKIDATHAAASFGSVGVAASFFVSDNLVEIANTDSPKKRPDVRTDGGKAMVREYLDSIHELFVSAIATGRGVPATKVVSDFGEGGVLLAAEAKRRKMIDRIAPAGSAARADLSEDVVDAMVDRANSFALLAQTGRIRRHPGESDAAFARRFLAGDIDDPDSPRNDNSGGLRGQRHHASRSDEELFCDTVDQLLGVGKGRTSTAVPEPGETNSRAPKPARQSDAESAYCDELDRILGTQRR